MKRDFDLIRAILLEAEGQDEPSSFGPLLGHSQTTVDYHVAIMIKGELLGGSVDTSASEQYGAVHPTGLAWEGHEFLDAVRDPEVWEKTKAQLGDALMSVGLPIVLAVATTYVKQKLGME